MPAKGYASHGESWSFALALRLASYELLRADGGDPVLVLDDVFAELDAGRRERLAELVAGAEQVLVTAAVPRGRPGGARGAPVDVVPARSAVPLSDRPTPGRPSRRAPDEPDAGRARGAGRALARAKAEARRQGSTGRRRRGRRPRPAPVDGQGRSGAAPRRP